MFVKIGAWKNFDELEESLTVVELERLMRTIRETENDSRVFQAAIQGIDLQKYEENSVEEKRREIERRAMEKIHGYEAVERQELAEFGIVFAT